MPTRLPSLSLVSSFAPQNTYDMILDSLQTAEIELQILEPPSRWGLIVQRHENGTCKSFGRQLIRVEHPDQPQTFHERRADELLFGRIHRRNNDGALLEAQDLGHGIVAAERDH